MFIWEQSSPQYLQFFDFMLIPPHVFIVEHKTIANFIQTKLDPNNTYSPKNIIIPQLLKKSTAEYLSYLSSIYNKYPAR